MEIEVIETLESKDIIIRNQWQSIALEMSIKIDDLQCENERLKQELNKIIKENERLKSIGDQ